MPTGPPSRLLRIATFICLWLVCGLVVYATYQTTDSCSPKAEHREAMLVGLLNPLFLSANASACIRERSWQSVALFGFLLAYGALAILLLGSRTIARLAAASVLLIILCGIGLWCTFYSYAHPAG